MIQLGYQINYKARALLVGLIALVLCFLARHFHLDDALIYARYILHALQGRGLEFNPGEPVNALTSVLYAWLVLGFSWIFHHNVLVVEWILSSGFLIAAALLAELLVPLSGLFVVSTGLFYYCIGMETSLFVFLILATAYTFARDKLNWLPLLCALTALARFEGAALSLVVAWWLWKQRRLPALRSFLTPLLLILLYFAFNAYFYHSLLPQSASAKFGQGMSGAWGRWPTAILYIPEIVFRPLKNSNLLALGLVLLACFGLRDVRVSRLTRVIAPFLVIVGLFYLLFNIPGYHWYYAPFLFFFIFYAVSLIPLTRASQWAALLFALCFAAATARDLHKNAHEDQDYASMGQWLNQHTAPGARIAATETGTIGWYCNRYIIDMVGITTPRNAHYTAHHDFSSWLAERPDYVVVHPAHPFGWEQVALHSSDYAFVPVHFGSVYLLHRKDDTAK